MTNSFNIVRNGSIALIAFILLALPFAAAHAADFDESGYDVYDYSQPSYDEPSYDVYDYSQPSYDSYDVYDYSQPSYGSYSPSYGGGSYLGGGYVSGGSYLPTAHSYPVASTGGQTQTQSSNNTNVNNNIITINTPSAPVAPAPVYNYPTCTLNVTNYQNGNVYNTYQPVTLNWTSQYATSGYISNGIGSVNLSGSITVNPQYTTTYAGTFTGQNGQTVTCSATVNRTAPIAYNTATPYISLSQAPYTGLDLGFWGTIAYWGFLVLWCLVAAYLIVVKKIQNRVLSALNFFLFGNATHTVAVAAPAATVSYSAPALTTQVDAIDDFILSQVNRGTRRS